MTDHAILCSTYVIDHLATHPDDPEAVEQYTRLVAARDAVLNKKRIPGSKVVEINGIFTDNPNMVYTGKASNSNLVEI